MWKKVMFAACMAIMATAAQAQIGYKGQLTMEASAGVNQTGGMVAAVHLGGYLSSHSVLGVAAMYDKTTYIGGGDDSFGVAQWLGNLHYQYSLPLGKVVLLPTGGVLLGVERSDSQTRQGNLVLYGSQFVYGISAALNVEYVLGRHWTIALQPRMAYLINTEFDAVKLSLSAGFKYYF